MNNKNIKITFVVFAGSILLLTCLNMSFKFNSIKGHIYEMYNRYQGPLDLAMPYIQEKYKDPSKIIIATNYEENSYMYYLGSKTIIGYVGNNLEEDKKLKPDVIIFRKNNFNQNEYLDIFNKFLNNKYQEVKFSLYDYAYNNIPELYSNPGHLYKTKTTTNDDEKLYLYIKE